jgi:hypothetical protein
MIDHDTQIWIPGNVPSSKNSKKIVMVGPRGHRRPKMLWSDLADRYRARIRPILIAERYHWARLTSGITPPVVVGFHFVRNSRRKFDFSNACQTIADLMVGADWLADDNMKEFVPMPLPIEGRWCSYNKEKPGVIIEPLNQH